MTEKQKSDMLKKELIKCITKRDVAGFLLDETVHFVQGINSYKLEKLTANKSLFKRFMYLLDDQNTKQIGSSLVDEYYMSKRGSVSLAKKKVVISQSRVIQIASKIKAMFVFQAIEFCNGSLDRMKVIDFAKIRASIIRKCKVDTVSSGH
jgi:hypothetical protein